MTAPPLVGCVVWSLDAGSSAILLMLDLSAAFDTIDHDILLARLCNDYGITGNALDLFRFYLTGRIQRVVSGAGLWSSTGFCVGSENLLHVHQTC